jgi:hypothetical protein
MLEWELSERFLTEMQDHVILVLGPLWMETQAKKEQAGGRSPEAGAWGQVEDIFQED